MSDSDAADGFSDAHDHESLGDEAQSLVTNDAVAGETVEPGLGEGNDGPTGGAPREASPEYAENDLEASQADVDLDGE